MSLRQAFLNLSITKKLVLINFIVVITALTITCTSVMLVQSTQMRSVTIKEMQTQADVISYNVAAALSFGDPVEAENILSALSKVSTVIEAAVFDADASLFARYQRVPDLTGAELVLPESLRLEERSQTYLASRYLHLTQAVTLGDEVIGILYLKVSLSHLQRLRNQAILIIALALGASLLISLIIIFRLQTIISRPILDLSATTKRISEDKIYSLRAPKTSKDELGVLIDGFNEMLETIEKRDEMLNSHKLHLENIVLSRTQELEDSNAELQETVRALKKASQTLQISEENKRIAEESAKTKARFLANMSHELRTPMNGVLGMLNLLADTQLQEDQAEYTHIALDSASVLLATLDEILDITKIEAGKLTIENKPFDLYQVIDEVFGLLGESAFNKGVELAWYRTDDISQFIVGDAHRTKQILYNLVNNAIKFTERGHVLLKVLHCAPLSQTEMPISVGKDEARYAFEISDTGLGIKPEAQARIFESFTQADDSTTRRFGGTGLGLALCKELTQLMGGDISVTSTFGEGSTFSAVLNVGVPAAPNEKALQMNELSAVQSSIPELLILEDQPVGEAVLACHLNCIGVKFRCARSLHEYLTLLSQVKNTDTILLIDLGLPDLDPDAIVATVLARAPSPKLRVVALGCLAQRQQLSSVNRKRLAAQWSKPIKHDAVERGLVALMSSGKVTYQPRTLTRVLGSQRTMPVADKRQPDKILVVEDNPVNQKVIVGRLARMGYSVETADNGAQALTKIKAASYDLVLMDCQMPVMDGYETTRCIREMPYFSGIPIVALTANALPGDREKCLSAGMDDYLVKPVDVNELQQKLTHWLNVGAERLQSVRQSPSVS